MFEEIRSKNPGLCIKSVNSTEFKKYGRVIDEYDFSQLVEYGEKHISIPDNGNIYVADDKNMHSFEIANEIMQFFYGEMPIQVGYCTGHNVRLNALEYHKSSEINVAVTDSILLVSSITEISDGKIDSKKVEAFYIKKGKAVELYGTTLHFSPCAVEKSGFKMIVILPEGTNLPLTSSVRRDPMLWMRNKWLLIHPEAENLKERGAYVGITGENIVVRF